MNILTYYTFLMTACLSFLLGWAPAAHAHGDEPRLEISPERLTPGAVLEIRGVDIEFEEQIILSLVGTKGEIPLGKIAADPEGIFHRLITVPSDLPEGTHTILAKADDHELQSPPITVSGVAPAEGGGQGPWEDEDNLLAPMPTSPMPISPVPVLPPNQQASPPLAASLTASPAPRSAAQSSASAGLLQPGLVAAGFILLELVLLLVWKR